MTTHGQMGNYSDTEIQIASLTGVGDHREIPLRVLIALKRLNSAAVTDLWAANIKPISNGVQ